MKKVRFLSIVLTAMVYFILCIVGCSDLAQQRKSDTISISVTLDSISYDDLGRVLVFTHDIDNTELVFIKDFYNKSAKKRSRKKEMKQYAASLKGLINEEVLVTFYENGIGDHIILKISKDTY